MNKITIFSTFPTFSQVISKKVNILPLALIVIFLCSTHLHAQVTYCVPTPNPSIANKIFNVSIYTLDNSTTVCSNNLLGSQGTGTGSGNYSDFTSSGVPIPELKMGTSQNISVTFTACSPAINNIQCKMFIDFNQNGSLSDPGEEFTIYPLNYPGFHTFTQNFSFTVPYTAVLGITRMRVINNASFISGPCASIFTGEVEDYSVNITTPYPCGGTPIVGTTSASNYTVCNNVNFTLSNIGSSPNVIPGITYQWQQSTSGLSGTWANISGANTSTYITNQSSSTYYRMYVACTNSLLADTSNAIQIISVAPTSPGAALAFDGLNDYVETTHNSGFNCTQFTIETWVKWGRPSGGLDFICSKGLNFMEIHTGGPSSSNIRFMPVPGVSLDAGPNTLQPGTWVHVAAVYNPSAGVAKLYINGIEKPLTSVGPSPLTTPIPANSSNFILGRRIDTSLPFKGEIDEFRFWNRALSQAEIQSQMNCEMATTTCSLNGLIQNLHFNQGMAFGNNTAITNITDASGNNNHGSLINFDRTNCNTNSNFTPIGGVTSGVICGGTILYVDATANGTNNGSTWANAFTNLQSALDVTCFPVTEIWVSKGTYVPSKDPAGTITNNQLSCFKMRNNVSIKGGFSTADGATTLATRNYTLYPTILSGDVQQDGIVSNNAYNVINNFQTGVNSSAELDGFTITKAYNNFNGIGGGVINANTSPTFLNCTFFDNFAGGTATARGAGMHNQQGATPYLENCTFSYNSTNGINNAFGSGMSNDNSTPLIGRCKFIGNICSAPNAAGGSIYCNGGSPITIDNCLFTDNNAAAILSDGNNVVLNYVTITNNTQSLTSVAGGLCFINCNPSIYNSIIYNNAGGSVQVYSGIPTFAYSDIQGSGAPSNWNGTYGVNYGANKDIAPNWNSNFKPYTCSPTVNAATSAFGISLKDLEGNARIFGSIPDMGCYEAGAPTIGIIHASICQGSTYNFMQLPGIFYNQTGVYNITLPGFAVGGCDSLITLNLTVTPPTASIINASICSNTYYIIPQIPGGYYNLPGTYNVTLPGMAANGCDSLITLNLTVKSTSTSTTSVQACSSYTWNGTTFTTSGLKTFTSTNVVGCDSIASLDLTIIPMPLNQTANALQSTICTGNSANIQISNTESDVVYTLLNTANANALSSPQQGNGSTLSLSTNQLSTNTSISILAQRNAQHALHFNGTNSYLHANTSINANQGTWEAWVSKDNWQDHHDDRLFGNGINSGTSNAFYISLHPSVGLHFRYGGVLDAGNTYASSLSSQNFSSNSWHHIAATWSTNAGITTITLFIDGNQVAFSTSTSTLLFGSSSFIGGGGDLTNPYFGSGKMDEVRLWNYAKTPSQIQASLFNCNLTTANGLVANWNFNYASGNAITPDVSGGNHNASMNNFNSTDWVVNTANCTSCDFLFPQTIPITATPCNTTLNLKLFLQGYYTGGGIMNTALANQGVGTSTTDVDSITIELHEAITPSTIIASTQTMLHTNGTATAIFNGYYSGNYYFVIKHRNSIETWSANPALLNFVTTFDFSTAASQAYGDNQVEVAPNVFAFYSGDIDQNGSIEAGDYSLWEFDSNNFEVGFLATDLDGDGSVGTSDYSIWEANANGFVGTIKP